ncbi:MAG: urease subunit gamma [Nitrosotalea sp.]
MIRIEVLVEGEPDIPPSTKLFEFKDEDEAIFLNVIEMVKDKLSRNWKLNTHESLVVFCSYIVSEIRSGKSESQIIDNSSKILTSENVLFGVPETLRQITFNTTVDNLSKKIIRFTNPIPIINYIMTDSKTIGVTCETQK